MHITLTRGNGSPDSTLAVVHTFQWGTEVVGRIADIPFNTTVVNSALLNTPCLGVWEGNGDTDCQCFDCLTEGMGWGNYYSHNFLVAKFPHWHTLYADTTYIVVGDTYTHSDDLRVVEFRTVTPLAEVPSRTPVSVPDGEPEPF